MIDSNSFQFAEVGGAVRDHLLGIKSKDVDFVAIPIDQHIYDSAADAFTHLVVHLKDLGFRGFESNGRNFILKPEFFTARVQVPNGHSLSQRTTVADFVLSRKDGPSSDGRRPDYVLPGTLLDDLERRDFTINAMAILNGELIDPFGGQKDLNERLIRFVGDPNERISEDGLRVMRALRFAITKNFYIHHETFDALNSSFGAEMLSKVSIERIYDELEKMFKANTMRAMDVLGYLIPELGETIFRNGLHLMPSLKQ